MAESLVTKTLLTIAVNYDDEEKEDNEETTDDEEVVVGIEKEDFPGDESVGNVWEQSE